MRLPHLFFLATLLMVSPFARADFGDVKRETVTYSSGGHQYPAHLYKPEGSGPFPAVIWLNGHADGFAKNNPDEYIELAKLYVREGFVLFIPDRHLHDISHIDYSAKVQELILSNPEAAKTAKAREEWEINGRDVDASISWLKQQPYVASDKLVLSGWSSGAALALMRGSKDKGVRALVLFAPGMSSWKSDASLPGKLTNAAKKCSLPVFLAGAKDDVTSEPFQSIGKEFKTKPNCRVQEYFHTGADTRQRTSMAINGMDAWGYDVVRYLETIVKD